MRTVEQDHDTASFGWRQACRNRSASLINAAKDGLLALSVGVGLGALAEMPEADVTEVVGANGKRNPDRAAVRQGHEDGKVTLDGRQIQWFGRSEAIEAHLRTSALASRRTAVQRRRSAHRGELPVGALVVVSEESFGQQLGALEAQFAGAGESFAECGRPAGEGEGC